MTDDHAPITVLRDPDRFKLKAQIGDRAYSWLRSMENLDQYLKAIATGSTAGMAIFIAAVLSMGPVGKVALALGIISLPWPIAVAVGLGTAGATLGTIKTVKRFRSKQIFEVPRFVSCPLDALAASVAEMPLPPCVLLSDKHKKAHGILVRDWGYDRKYVEWLAEQVTQNPGKFSLTSRALKLRTSRFVMKHVECDHLTQEIERLATGVSGIRDDARQKLFEAFNRYLAGDKDITLDTVSMLEEVVLGHVVASGEETPCSEPRAREAKLPLWRRIFGRNS